MSNTTWIGNSFPVRTEARAKRQSHMKYDKNAGLDWFSLSHFPSRQSQINVTDGASPVILTIVTRTIWEHLHGLVLGADPGCGDVCTLAIIRAVWETALAVAKMGAQRLQPRFAQTGPFSQLDRRERFHFESSLQRREGGKMLGEFLGNALRNIRYAHELAKVNKLFIRVALPFRKRRRRRRALAGTRPWTGAAARQPRSSQRRKCE